MEEPGAAISGVLFDAGVEPAALREKALALSRVGTPQAAGRREAEAAKPEGSFLERYGRDLTGGRMRDSHLLRSDVKARQGDS